MEQRTEEWLKFRSSRIGASDSAIICGISPWKSIHELWLEKTGQVQSEYKTNFAIERGNRLEPLVRALTETFLDLDFPAETRTSKERAFLMASLDGWNSESSSLLEIKVGNREDHARDVVPIKYFPQIQQQMYVFDSDTAYYASYYVGKGTPEDRGDLKILMVKRNEEWLAQYLNLADRFYESMQNRTPPEIVRLDPQCTCAYDELFVRLK